MSKRFSSLPSGKEFKLDLSSYDQLPFPEGGFLNDKTVFKKLEGELQSSGKKVNAIESDTGKGVFIGDWEVIVVVPDHWDHLAEEMRDLIAQTSDERLGGLYKILQTRGWNQRIFPLSTRNVDSEVKFHIMHAVGIETVERREGRIISVS